MLKETVLVIALALAAVSMAFVPPSADYVSYFDFKVLSCLFCLMAVVAGLRTTGVFETAAAAIFRFSGNTRVMTLLLVFATFFLSMAVTNDVALITLVPFSLLLLKNVPNHATRMTVITMQTIGANVGSSLTPVGNPQNLFLFSFYEMKPLAFFAAIAPLVALGGILLALSVFFVRSESLPSVAGAAAPLRKPVRIAFYAALFIVSVLSVFQIIDWRVALVIVSASILVIDRSLFFRIDYSLLFTFAGFFVFIGNLRQIERVRVFFTSVVSKNVTLVSALASQGISNVPAAILLSQFTEDAGALLRGVSIGGMGTIIASLASVISFKAYVREYPSESLKYLSVFTVWNILFFLILYGASSILY